MTTVELAVDEALGPGIDVIVDAGAARVVAGREGRLWLGLDRAHLLDSDTGNGTEVPAVVALPASSFAGCRVEAELAGALADGDRVVLVAHLPGQALPPDAMVRTVARVQGGRWLDAVAADRVAREARQRFRVRRQAGRVHGGRAWQAGGNDPAQRRFTTPYSRAEYRLDRLPPRFGRGLEGLLDADERLLYAIERPPESLRGGRLGLPRRAAERRAGLLLLTDRQLIWMVDHMPPDRYLLDWGVDARLVALEALREVRLTGDETLELHVQTRGGGAVFALPGELRAEAEVLRDLAARFLPIEGMASLLRRYAPAAVEFDPAPAALFRQGPEAAREVAALRAALAPEDVLAAFYTPRRAGHPEALVAGVTASRIGVLRRGELRMVDLAVLRDISITLSPLVGRVEFTQPSSSDAARTTTFSYPATMSSGATTLLRVLRRAWADRASAGPVPNDAAEDAKRRVA